MFSRHHRIRQHGCRAEWLGHLSNLGRILPSQKNRCSLREFGLHASRGDERLVPNVLIQQGIRRHEIEAGRWGQLGRPLERLLG